MQSHDNNPDEMGLSNQDNTSSLNPPNYLPGNNSHNNQSSDIAHDANQTANNQMERERESERASEGGSEGGREGGDESNMMSWIPVVEMPPAIHQELCR